MGGFLNERTSRRLMPAAGNADGGLMEAPADRPMMCGGPEGRLLVRAWLAAFLVPLVFAVLLEARDFETEERGSGCLYLTDAGQMAFDHAVIGLQVVLLAWALAGGAIVAVALLRRLEHSGGAWLTIAGWLVGVAGAALLAWFGPTIGSLGKVTLIFVYVPILLAGSALVMTLGLAWRRARGRAFPAGLLLRSQAVLIAVLMAGSFLGGTGEIESC
jgi:hypothetical protein